MGVTFPIIMIISAFASLIGMGGAPLASIKMGEGDQARAERIMGNCFATLLGLSAVLTVFFLLPRIHCFIGLAPATPLSAMPTNI